MAISAIVIMGTYSLFNIIFKAHSTTSENLFYTGIYNGLSKLINDDFINMVELSDEQLKAVDNETDESEDNNGQANNSTNNSLSPSDNSSTNNDNQMDNKTRQNYIILNTKNNHPELIFSTYNSLFFNKAVPVTITYYIDEENYFTRTEENDNLSFKKDIKLIGNVEDFQVAAFNGEDFIEDTVNPKLMRLIFIIDGRTYQISAGKFILDEK